MSMARQWPVWLFILLIWNRVQTCWTFNFCQQALPQTDTGQEYNEEAKIQSTKHSIHQHSFTPDQRYKKHNGPVGDKPSRQQDNFGQTPQVPYEQLPHAHTKVEKEDRSMIVATNSSFFCCGETPTQEFENFLKEDKERMMNEIQAMEKSLPPAELKAKLHEYLKGCFNEIIKADPIYGVVLEKIKISYENLLVENAKKVQEVTGIKDYLVKERRRGDKLEKENIELTKEYEKQCTLIDSQKILIKELKKQVNDSSLEAKGQQKVESLMGEIKTLYKENTKLESTIKKLSFDLKQSKAREATLAKLLKGDSLVATNEFSSIKENGTSFCVPAKVLTESKDLNKTEYKDSTIGKSKPKNKVVVPKLDFSKLPQKKQAQLKVVHCEPCSASSSEENFEQKLKAELGKGKLIRMQSYEVELMGNEKEEVANEEESENILDQVIDEISSSWRDMLKYKQILLFFIYPFYY
eukprot:TRINITY_DN2965_c0_g1_i1.p3 TRINITY_DN2965_c0_g1~~TRINITY_DN2965_c0_g1_i1.p3  ORF type:complete len:466 (+),score=50.40 TRINITY_DN2965_c0_g1_i1:3440-4837(+)